jgi:hypothetical protein
LLYVFFCCLAVPFFRGTRSRDGENATTRSSKGKRRRSALKQFRTGTNPESARRHFIKRQRPFQARAEIFGKFFRRSDAVSSNRAFVFVFVSAH